MCCEVLHVDQQEQALTESNMILYIYYQYALMLFFVVYNLYLSPLF
jgi:hypothetical protein